MHNTVVGNVSRTHRPCGECRALVDDCAHYRVNAYRGGPRPRRTRPPKSQEEQDFIRTFRED